jgi:hypothetical protein
MPVGHCKECDRLWAVYTAAIMAQLRVVSDEHRAAMRHDSAAVAELGDNRRDAEQRMQAARQALQDHQVNAHAVEG